MRNYRKMLGLLRNTHVGYSQAFFGSYLMPEEVGFNLYVIRFEQDEYSINASAVVRWFVKEMDLPFTEKDIFHIATGLIQGEHTRIVKLYWEYLDAIHAKDIVFHNIMKHATDYETTIDALGLIDKLNLPHDRLPNQSVTCLTTVKDNLEKWRRKFQRIQTNLMNLEERYTFLEPDTIKQPDEASQKSP